MYYALLYVLYCPWPIVQLHSSLLKTILPEYSYKYLSLDIYQNGKHNVFISRNSMFLIIVFKNICSNIFIKKYYPEFLTYSLTV